METEASTIPTPRVPASAGAVGLSVVGGDLLLRGRFARWLPLVLANAPTDDGHATAQILFDVTSNRSQPRSKHDRDLFTFSATSVKPAGPHAYTLKGPLRADGKSRTAEALLQSPAAHTPFFVITFAIDREGFGGLWSTLEEMVARPGQTELHPEAWLREPELAAA